MKRALAERAKQSGLPNGTGPSEPDPGEAVTQAVAENGGGSNVPLDVKSAPTASPRPRKRVRETLVKLDEEDEDDANASAFFLRHQNRALTSELRQMKHQLTRLERERDIRRAQCTRAVQNLNTLQVTWSQMEEILKQGESSPSSETEKLPEGTSSAPLSTGSGPSVELIGALFNSLAALGSSSATRIISEDAMEVDDSDEEELHLSEPLAVGGDDEHSDPSHQEELSTLMRITDNVSKRANTLQGWILTLLQRIENGDSAENPRLSNVVQRAQQQVARLKAKNKILKSKIEELSRSRDELHESDRRVRRGLYRMASNRVQLKEVLKAIVAADDDKEAAAEWMEPGAGQISVAAPTGTSAAIVATKTEDTDTKKTAVSSEELAELQKKILDLEQIASSRDDQIKKVSPDTSLIFFVLVCRHFSKLFSILAAFGTRGTNEEDKRAYAVK